MSVTNMALVAALVWVGADVAIVGGWLATVGLVRRRHTRRMMVHLGLSTTGSSTGAGRRHGAAPFARAAAFRSAATRGATATTLARRGFAARPRRRGW